MTKTKSADNGFLTREKILGADDKTFEDVAVPEWGGQVRVFGLSGEERDAFEASLIVKTRVKGRASRDVSIVNIRAKLGAATMGDSSGQLLFSPDDVMALGRKSASALERVYAVAQRLSGFSDQDIEDLAKNSDETPPVGSS